MQQPSPTQAPPAAPIAPEAPAPPAPVALPDGPVPLEALPKTTAEVQGLRARREILRDQLSRASNRRDELAQQLDGDLAGGARAGIQQRLDLLDQRILQLEREQATTERQLSGAPPAVLARTSEPAPRGGMMSEDDATGLAAGTFGLGVLLTLVIGRLRRRRHRNRADAASPALSADPRFDQLTLAVDAMAEEVERIGEGQRFVTQLLAAQRDAAPALNADPARR